MILISDTVAIEKTRVKTPEGFLFARAYLGRTGVQEYRPGDAGYLAMAGAKPELSGRAIRLLRPAEEVFDQKSLSTIGGKPITNEHPGDAVTAENYKDFVVGAVGSEPFRDGDFVAGNITLYDATTIAEVEAGKSELSLGYTTEVDWSPGQGYDGIQREIRVNHVAITDRGRAGHDVRILDTGSSKEGKKMAERLVGGVTITVDDSAVRAVDAFLSDAESMDKKLAELTGAKSALETEIVTLRDEVKKLNDSAYIAGKVADRMRVIDAAKRIAPALVCDSLSDAEIMAKCLETRKITVTGEAEARGAFAALSLLTCDAVRIGEASAATPVDTVEAEYRAACAARNGGK